MDPDLAILSQAVAADIAAERGPVAWLRSRSRGARGLVVLAVVAAELALFWGALLRQDLGQYPPARLALVAGGYALILALAAWTSLRPIYLAEPRRRLRALVALAVMAPVAVALLPELATAPGYQAEGYICFAGGLVLSLPALLTCRILDRGGHRAGTAAILAAVSAGMVGTLAMQLQCPINESLHLLAAHAPIPTTLIAGIWLLRRLA
jgi:hypothetical protein